MGKENIPFELFRERKFYEGRPVEVIDIRKCKSGKEYAAVMEKYFDDIFSVTLEDLKSLTAEEINSIPDFWLYDWLHCQGHYSAEGEIEKFIEGIHLKRREGKRLFTSRKQQVYSFFNGREQFTAQEMQDELRLSYEEFIQIAYWLIAFKYVQFKDGIYTRVKKSKR